MGFNQDLPENQGGKTIMYAHWPKPLDDDFKDYYGLGEHVAAYVEQKYELVRQGRNLRREANLAPGRKVKFFLKPLETFSGHETTVLTILLGAESLEIDPAYSPKKGTPSARSPLGELYLPLEGLIDVQAEKARLGKELAKVMAEVEKVQQKLNNPNFTQKVPPSVLQEHQRRLAEWQEKQARVEAAIQGLN